MTQQDQNFPEFAEPAQAPEPVEAPDQDETPHGDDDAAEDAPQPTGWGADEPQGDVPVVTEDSTGVEL
jgi:hypothetical protein